MKIAHKHIIQEVKKYNYRRNSKRYENGGFEERFWTVNRGYFALHTFG